jgi:uncharacterized protein with GYD domain
MPLFLAQVSYTAEAWAALVRNPHDRLNAVVQPLMEQLGGTAVGAWFSFGEYDVVVIYEVPDNVSAAAAAITIGSGGAVKSLKTTPLMTVEEGVEALTKAQSLTYSPPQ